MDNQRAYQLPKGASTVIRLAMGMGAHRIINQINHWLMASGPEWTVQRLKALRTAALHIRAGSGDKAKSIYQENSIAYFHGSLIPRGPMGRVIGAYVKATQPAVLRRWDAVLRVYTSIRLQNPSRAQVRKAKKSITSPFSGDEKSVENWSKRLRVAAGQLARKYPVRLRIPDIRRLRPLSSTFRRVGRTRTEKDTPYFKLADSLVSEGRWPEQVARARSLRLTKSGLNDYVRQFRATLYDEGTMNTTYSGRIALIQEAGCKGRVVAVPTAYTQWFFEPLHQYLADVTQREFSNSMVTNQADSAYWLRDKLNRGKVYCFDLSSATDRFPRALQLEVLRGFGLNAYADDLEDLCHSWLGLDGTRWDYAVGQPMGLYGSFPLFHLSHLMILWLIWKDEHIVGDFADACLVLGDDVVIRDQVMAEKYRETLLSFGVEISETKSIASQNIAEFAGFLVHRTVRGTVAYRPYKYGNSANIHSPLNFLFSLGKKVRKLGDRWARLYDVFIHTTGWRAPDLSPLVPQDAKAGILPEVVDTTRLTSVLTEAYHGHSPTYPEEGLWSWWGARDLQFAQVFCGTDIENWTEEVANQLLGKELMPEFDRTELLSTPNVSDEFSSDWVGKPEMSIRKDPLMGTALSQASLLTSHEQVPIDPNLGIDQDSKDPGATDDPDRSPNRTSEIPRISTMQLG